MYNIGRKNVKKLHVRVKEVLSKASLFWQYWEMGSSESSKAQNTRVLSHIPSWKGTPTYTYSTVQL
jgi:hypothetical protein